MGLRIKILSGFLILSLMLLIAGLWSIYELQYLGSSVGKILDENYQSIHAAKNMKEALEREDSAILLLMLGKWEQGRHILGSADSVFMANFNFANRNITIPGEEERLKEIADSYNKYKALWERPIVDTDKEGNLDWYFSTVHLEFLSAKSAVDELINLNDQIMYRTASELENRSNQAIMPGIIAVLSALVFTLIFNYLVNYYFVSPIIRITDRIKKFEERRIPYEVKIETTDEIFHLSNAIDHLCRSLSNGDDRE